MLQMYFTSFSPGEICCQGGHVGQKQKEEEENINCYLILSWQEKEEEKINIVTGLIFLQPGEYIWQTYKEVYEIVIKVGSAIRSLGIEKVKQITNFTFGIDVL